jgi:flagellum-specific peptidoglycan hydrolase FlgJ
MNQLQRDFLTRAAAEAVRANHPFAMMAACEAALESSWGHSQLAMEGNNLFGMKQHVHPIYGTMTLPTREWQRWPGDLQAGDVQENAGRWIVVGANWVKYPDWRACFADRLATLERLSNAYPHYKAALDAKDAQSYVAEVSKSWSTDPRRAEKVLSIYQEFVAVPPAISGAGTPTNPAT